MPMIQNAVKETQVQHEFGEGGTLEEETGELKV
jgi:hypothetical protein